MLPLLQMGQDEPLPVQRQPVHADIRRELQSASRRAGFHHKVHLRVVPQGFEVSHALHGGGDGLAVADAARVERDLHAEAPLHQLLQHLCLHSAHQLYVQFLCPLLPEDVELRLLLLQAFQLRQHGSRVHSLRKQHAVGQDRREQRHASALLKAKALARPGVHRSCHGDHHPGLRFLQRREL